MPILTLAAKDLRLFLRDARSAVILLVMPVILILVLGLSLGEGFGEKPDERLRVSVVNLDRGLPPRPGRTFPPKPWSEVVMDDLSATADIRLEIVTDRAEAERLINRNQRAAVIVFGEDFSEKVDRASFLSKGDPPPVNPLGSNGVRFDRLGLTLLKDQSQPVTSSVIEQVTQVTLMRVVVPWMIGRAFQRVGDPEFMAYVATKLAGVAVPPEVLAELDPVMQKLLDALLADKEFQAMMLKAVGPKDALTIASRTTEFKKVMAEAFHNKALMARVGKRLNMGEVLTPSVREQVGPSVKEGVRDLFSNYNFESSTWADLTKDQARGANDANRTTYADTEGSGFLKRGALRYQTLVPSYTVMFAFFLVLSVGWLFVAERKHGTLTRLRAAPLTRGHILLGKLLPCLGVSLVQGFFLLLAGKLVFGMSWGAHPWLLVPLVVCTSVAAVGLAMLVASLAKTEGQVAVYGTLLILVLGGISGTLMPRDLMPEQMKRLSLVTPQAWALDAYSQLLTSPTPQLDVVARACGVLLAFGLGFLALAWWRMDLE